MILKLYVLDVVGVPLNKPLDDNVKPAGGTPISDQVGVVITVTLNDFEYDAPKTPGARAAGVITGTCTVTGIVYVGPAQPFAVGVTI